MARAAKNKSGSSEARVQLRESDDIAHQKEQGMDSRLHLHHMETSCGAKKHDSEQGVICGYRKGDVPMAPPAGV